MSNTHPGTNQEEIRTAYLYHYLDVICATKRFRILEHNGST